ncbi:unnamed protein product [Camellia sinensis]
MLKRLSLLTFSHLSSSENGATMAYAAMKSMTPGLEKSQEQIHKIRITLSSKNAKNLEKEIIILASWNLRNATEVKVLNYNETIEIVFQDTNVMDTSMNHPIHFHGYSFYVVGTGYGNFNNETDPDS